jgi:hypothetical protein
MRLAELERKWVVGDAGGWTVVSDDAAVLVESRAPLGDLVEAYLTHRAIPWWRRLFWAREWRMVGQRMRDRLNDHAVVVWVARED